MQTLSILLCTLVALEHLYFLYLEMFLWTRPSGLKIFAMTAEKALSCKALAANPGLYNGFLAAGIIWGLLYPDQQTGLHIQLFFIICIMTAAIYATFTVQRSILYIQGLPALLALISLLMLLT